MTNLLFTYRLIINEILHTIYSVHDEMNNNKKIIIKLLLKKIFLY